VTEGVPLHQALERALPAARAIAGPGVAVRLDLALVDGRVAVPAEDLHDAVLALARNAAQAMPEGGVLTLRTEHVEAAGGELGPVPPLAPGRYMRLTVQDTGRGMDEAQRVRALDRAEGAVRGLARVLALVRRIHGAVWLDSAPGLGTRAFLYLPLAALPATPARAVLLVEDESAVRAVVRRLLLGQGFTVREARDGAAALRLWQAERGHIAGVVTDIVMPVLGGRDLALAIRADDPGVPLLFISAYAGDLPELLEGVEPPRELLLKPFTNDAMLAALRALLAPG
jgi:two-component system cell cycle sensor histidine kinase/response regulator CckA